jgi:isopropylmalate/homocitrate/citramalate synthase
MDDVELFEWVRYEPQGKWWVSQWNLRPEVVEELNLPSKVILKDTTLREGEETPNVNMTLEDKLAIARMLCEMGIQEADAGYVGTVERDRIFAKKVKSEGLELKLAAHAYALGPNFRKEIDTICEAEVEIVQIVLHPVPVEGYRRRDYLLRLIEAVRYVKDRGLFVVFLPVLTNWEPNFCWELLQAAAEGGVDRICPAGLGCLHVTAYKNLVKWIKKSFPGVQVGVHVHNDYGLATACSLASVEAGAEVVDAAVNGMCDRSGIAALEEVAMALTILYGMDLGIRLDRLTELSRLVQKISDVPLQPYKPIVGENIFIQNTDSHIVSEIKGKWSIMNSFDPSFIGGKGKILFGPHSLSGQGLRAKIEAMGLKATEGQIVDLLRDMENLLKIQKAIPEEEVEQMVKKKLQSI